MYIIKATLYKSMNSKNHVVFAPLNIPLIPKFNDCQSYHYHNYYNNVITLYNIVLNSGYNIRPQLSPSTSTWNRFFSLHTYTYTMAPSYYTYVILCVYEHIVEFQDDSVRSLVRMWQHIWEQLRTRRLSKCLKIGRKI